MLVNDNFFLVSGHCLELLQPVLDLPTTPRPMDNMASDRSTHNGQKIATAAATAVEQLPPVVVELAAEATF